jgi:hypothetical protein
VAGRPTPRAPGNADIAMAFVGAMIPDEPRFHGPAFNRAAQTFQRELLLAVARAGLEPTAIYSIEPTPAFPRSRRLFKSVSCRFSTSSR